MKLRDVKVDTTKMPISHNVEDRRPPETIKEDELFWSGSLLSLFRHVDQSRRKNSLIYSVVTCTNLRPPTLYLSWPKPLGQQAHDLTPTPRRDPEMSRHIPAHNQPLHEMSAGRAAAHERNNKQRQKTGAHAGSGTNHAPPGPEGKHSTMPYGDMGILI